jgi:hypothetical protein
MIREVPKNKFPVRIFAIPAWTQDDRLKCMQVIFELTSMSLIVASLALMISSSCGVMSREFPVDSLPSLSSSALTRLGIGVAARVPIPYSSKTYNQPQQDFSSKSNNSNNKHAESLDTNDKKNILQYIQEQVSCGHGLQTGLQQIHRL